MSVKSLGVTIRCVTMCFRKSVQQQMTAKLDAAQREQAEAAMREQARQNAYRIAEAVVP